MITKNGMLRYVSVLPSCESGETGFHVRPSRMLRFAQWARTPEGGDTINATIAIVGLAIGVMWMVIDKIIANGWLLP